MSQIFYLKSTDEDTGTQNIVVFVPGAEAATCDDSHPNFDTIVAAVEDGAPIDEIIELFDVSETVSKRFESLSDRVSVANGRIYLDGDEVENALTRQVVRFLDEGLSDWLPLVHFFENVQANPEPHSREQLFEWLNRHDFAITNDGNFIAYKGLTADYKSTRSGPGIVNGEAVDGQLDNSVGNVVEIARSVVHHDPSQGCASGLHVGTYEFAKNWGRGGQFVKVSVNPRDVVSVPTDSNAQKVRVCRYTVLEDAQSVKPASAFDTSGWFDDTECDEGSCDCGDPDCDW